MQVLDDLARLYDERGATRFAHDAVALRRWDDRAKDPGRAAPPFATYRGLLARICIRRLNPY